MKDLFPDKPVVEILNIQLDKNDVTIKKLLLFAALTKAQQEKFSFELTRYLTFPKGSDKRILMNNELKMYHSFTFDDIIAIGTTEIETRMANSYIASNTQSYNGIVKRQYKCFVNDDWKDPKNRMNLPYHDDGGCSWNCLMLKLRNPEYGIIFMISLNKRNKFGINGEDSDY